MMIVRHSYQRDADVGQLAHRGGASKCTHADLVQGAYELGFDRDLFRLCLGMKMERE